MLGVGDGLADGDVRDAGQADDVAGSGLVDVDALQAVESKQLRHARRLQPAVELADRHGVAEADPAVEHAADGNAPEVVARVQVGHEDLERGLRIADRRRNRVDDRLEERAQVRAGHGEVGRRGAGSRVGVEDGEVQLPFRCVEVDEQVVDLVEHFAWPRVLAVDLVDGHDRRQAPLEGLAQHVSRPWQRSFRRVDEQQHAVDHRERPLDLAPEVGVARGVDDVDERVAVVERGVLREDGDAALALQVGVVERALRDPLVRAERAALRQKHVDERGLPVIDVRNDGDVAPVGIGDCLSGRKLIGHPPSIPGRTPIAQPEPPRTLPYPAGAWPEAGASSTSRTFKTSWSAVKGFWTNCSPCSATPRLSMTSDVYPEI